MSLTTISAVTSKRFPIHCTRRAFGGNVNCGNLLSGFFNHQSASKRIALTTRRQYFNSRIIKSNTNQSQKNGSKAAIEEASATNDSGSSIKTMISKFLGPKEMPKRGTMAWYREMVLICTVFAITGTSTMVLVRPAVSKGLGIQGSLKEGPNSYRICSLIIMSPIYSALLVVVGTIFGRHTYFRYFSVKMISRFGIPAHVIDDKFPTIAKNFKKW